MFFPHEPVTDIGAAFIANRPQLRMAALKILGNIQRAEDEGG